MLTGDMPIVGGSRFGVRPAQPQRAEVRVVAVAPGYGGGGGSGLLPPRPNANVYYSATKVPLAIGQVVRGSDKTTNRTVDRNFRGRILEFIPPTSEGNNTRVKCLNTGKVYRVKSTEIRSAT